MKDEHSTMPKPISTPNKIPTILVLPLLLELLFTIVGLNPAMTQEQIQEVRKSDCKLTILNEYEKEFPK